ncbi:hypothetical protein KI387_031889 [Taxus chinensis]|uniref:Laccase n=1 Tax=Taxus chinensis TaxID=29808 RepID=A0AA38F4P1_TAXCH|nr:hypothetical protein KI387_031889 [Taxus chinensis]
MAAGISFVALLSVFLITPWTASAALVHHKFIVGTEKVRRLCTEQEIVTVNGQFPGPTIYVHEGDNLVVQVENRAPYNLTIHWHGVKQVRSCWMDGPAYITQCPIITGNSFNYNFNITEQEGTLWWHAHISYLRATVHGALVIYPRIGNHYPFPKPHAEFPIILGEWWNANVEDVLSQALRIGGVPNESDAYTINSHPGDLFPCSANDTVRFLVKRGKTYLLRIVNAALNHPFFFKIAHHKLTVVAGDASYTKPYKTNVVLIYPGQTKDVLLKTSKRPGLYYMGARVYRGDPLGPFINITTTAILEYRGRIEKNNSVPVMPTFPPFNDTPTAFKFNNRLKSLRPSVPQSIDEEMLITQGFGVVSCPNKSCAGPNGGRPVGSFNNISFVEPHIALLQAYFYGIDGVFTTDFPDKPPLEFNYTGPNLPSLWEPELGTKVKVLKYNSSLQIVFQATSLITTDSHPIHIHGYDFHVVGQGFGNYDPQTDPANFNLADPQIINTVAVPTAGWAAIRFRADNPGVWFVHCHFESHSANGFNMVFLVEDGAGQLEILPPPPHLPKC